MVGHLFPMNFQQCRAYAWILGKSMFGFEDPSEFDEPGMSKCLISDSVNGMQSVNSGHLCRSKVDAAGHSLGGQGYIAWYLPGSTPIKVERDLEMQYTERTLTWRWEGCYRNEGLQSNNKATDPKETHVRQFSSVTFDQCFALGRAFQSNFIGLENPKP